MYFDYVGESEAPVTYHRWSLISLVGALLNRQFYLPFGHTFIYPNQYIMLMGEAASRKSSSIGIVEKLARKAGYTRFAADRLSKEMFLKSMMIQKDPKDEWSDDDIDIEMLLDEVLPDSQQVDVSDIYAVADEFLDLVGPANVEFLTMFTKLWDNKDEYSHPKLHGVDVRVSKPTVNILAGNTPTGITLTCPPELVGQGFMSRLLLIFSEPSNRRYYLPRQPNKELEGGIVGHLKEMLKCVKGVATITPEADKLMERIYKECPPMSDFTFKHYNGRRYTHLLKIALVLAAMDLTTEVDAKHLLQANTILHYAETRMPKALGEFGRGKHNATSSDIVNILASSIRPVGLKELWSHVGKDLTKPQELTDIMRNLAYAGKIRAVDGEGFTLVHKVREEWSDDLILTDFLDTEEME